MASPRLETFCCPNRDAATEFVVTFQPVLFGSLTLASAALSLVFAVLQLLPKRKGYRRLGQYPLPRPASSSRILLIISVCDILGCVGKDRNYMEPGRERVKKKKRKRKDGSNYARYAQECWPQRCSVTSLCLTEQPGKRNFSSSLAKAV